MRKTIKNGGNRRRFRITEKKSGGIFDGDDRKRHLSATNQMDKVHTGEAAKKQKNGDQPPLTLDLNAAETVRHKMSEELAAKKFWEEQDKKNADNAAINQGLGTYLSPADGYRYSTSSPNQTPTDKDIEEQQKKMRKNMKLW